MKSDKINTSDFIIQKKINIFKIENVHNSTIMTIK